MTSKDEHLPAPGRRFLDLPISAKLNIVLIGSIVLVLGIAGASMSYWLTNKLEERSMAEMRRINRQVVDMIDAYGSVLERSAGTLGEEFAASLPKHLTVDANSLIATGEGTFPALHGGGITLNNNVALTDAFTAATGAVATIFVRQGDDFVRVATSLKKQDGQRAQGTPLGSTSPAYAKIMAGERYVGRANLFGRDYATSYVPLKDESGKVVGIAFVGMDFSDGLKELKQKVLSIKVGETGYVFALDAKDAPGKAMIHPAAEGKNLIDVTDSDGRQIIKEMIAQRNGELRYHWTNAKLGETGTREKITVFETYDRWGWLIGTGSYMDEFRREVRTLQIQGFVAGMVIVSLLAAVVYFVTRRWIDVPLGEGLTAVHRVADGDFTVTVPERGKDEVGQLMHATNQMCARLRTMIAEIHDSVARLSANAEQLSSAAHTVAEGSAQQSNAASAMATDIEEMSASIGTVSSNAEEARTMAEKSGEISESGAAVINQAIGSMNSIAATVTQSSQTVGELGVQSQKIHSIVEAIREIADQTNLLALNAAIEAARAGEQGRGFAVVADEVRQLAERTAKSTEEITTMVRTIQSDAVTAVESMSRGVAEVERGVGLANEAGTSIASIRSGAAHVGHAVVGISDALREQTIASGDISNLVAQIADQAEQNQVMAQQTSASAADMEQLANQLRASISRFRI